MSRSTRSETAVSILMAIALPALATAAASALDAGDVVVVFAAGAGGLIGTFWMGHSLSTRARQVVDLRLDNQRASDELVALRTEIAFRERVDDALRDSDGESTTIALMLRAVEEIVPDSQISFLLSQPDNHHLGWAVTVHDGALDPAVPIHNSPRCRALDRAMTVTSRSNHEVGACEHLVGQQVEVASLCVPLSLGDRILGIVNVICPPGQPPSDAATDHIEWIIGRCAMRMTEQRLERGPSTLGSHDPVTGLPGPEAFRGQLKDLVRALVRFSIAIVSIDHYAEIMMDHGPDTDETMLLAVSDSLVATLRPDDFVCRYGESTFAVVLPGCDAARAAAVIERTRESLALLLVVEGEMTFTCSAGVAESNQATSIDSLIEMAESTCDKAVAAGGNRVLVTFGTDHM